jgi:hypothetical protein
MSEMLIVDRDADNIRIIDGRGKLVPDAFTEIRLASLPPGVLSVRSFPISS